MVPTAGVPIVMPTPIPAAQVVQSWAVPPPVGSVVVLAQEVPGGNLIIPPPVPIVTVAPAPTMGLPQGLLPQVGQGQGMLMGV